MVTYLVITVALLLVVIFAPWSSTYRHYHIHRYIMNKNGLSGEINRITDSLREIKIDNRFLKGENSILAEELAQARTRSERFRDIDVS